MTEYRDMDERFDGFKSAYEAGNGDPLPFMEGLDRAERRRFRSMIDRYLDENPARLTDLKRLRDPEFARMIGQVSTKLDGLGGGMSTLVVGLREQRQLLQEDVVAALARDLEASDAEEEKIDDYYHDLEFGNLPAKGISGTLLSSLAKILGTTAERLKKAGEALGPSGSQASSLIYTRMADNAEEIDMGQAAPAIEAPSGVGRRSDPPHRIDELFTGG